MSDRKKPLPLRGVLEAALPYQVARRLPPPELIRAWNQVVGPVLGARARPVCLEANSVLVVAVSAASWRQEISLAATGIVRELCQKGFEVGGLKLVLARTPPHQPPPPPVLPDMDASEEAEVQRTVADVSDPGLRQTLADLMRTQIKVLKAAGK